MDEKPEITPAEAAILMNMEIRRRVVEALYETLVGDRFPPGENLLLQADDYGLKAGLRAAISVLITDVLGSKEYAEMQRRREGDKNAAAARQYQQMQDMMRAQQQRHPMDPMDQYQQLLGMQNSRVRYDEASDKVVVTAEDLPAVTEKLVPKTPDPWYKWRPEF